MKQKRHWALTMAIGAMMVLAGGCGEKKTRSGEATQLVEAAYRQKDYGRLAALADSLEKSGQMTAARANYWRGYACDRTKRKQEAAAYWRTSMEEAVNSTVPDDADYYAKSASRLANLLCLEGDYEGALAMAQPVVARLEQLRRDSTSDYINLLIYVGLCQVSTGMSEEDTRIGFYRAYEKHRQNIEKYHSDEAYKDAIAGLVNIAYYCVKAHHYEPALYYTSNFGDLLIEYEQRPGVDTNYVDRQVGRYTIYKAWALDRLGRKKESKKTYEAFLATRYSQGAEGRALANDFLTGNEDGGASDDVEAVP